jgi:hypothetical protein
MNPSATIQHFLVEAHVRSLMTEASDARLAAASRRTAPTFPRRALADVRPLAPRLPVSGESGDCGESVAA